MPPLLPHYPPSSSSSPPSLLLSLVSPPTTLHSFATITNSLLYCRHRHQSALATVRKSTRRRVHHSTKRQISTRLRRIVKMSKLSPSLKALVNHPRARGEATQAPVGIKKVFANIASDAKKQGLGYKPWLALTTATTFTLNSPDSLPILHAVASSSSSSSSPSPLHSAELIREVGLKCISFNGIPRTINNLNAFHASLPPTLQSQLATTPTRTPTASSLSTTTTRGRALWDSVYRPFEDKLYTKLAASHPDLPVHILNSHYAGLLSDPEERNGLASVGRGLTSVVAVSCLRAQTGVGPQVLSHVFGLRKGLEDGTMGKEVKEEGNEGLEWLATDEGSEWMLNTVDTVVEALGGANFARL